MSIPTLTTTLLRLRSRLPDRLILDCLDLANYLNLPAGAVNPPRRISTAELAQHWRCDGSIVSRQLKGLREHGLLDATTRSGPGARWEITRIGP